MPTVDEEQQDRQSYGNSQGWADRQKSLDMIPQTQEEESSASVDAPDEGAVASNVFNIFSFYA